MGDTQTRQWLVVCGPPLDTSLEGVTRNHMHCHSQHDTAISSRAPSASSCSDANLFCGAAGGRPPFCKPQAMATSFVTPRILAVQ